MLTTSENLAQTHYPPQPTVATQGCIETLEQGYQFLQSITDEQYCYAAPPHITSTVGQHFRHLLDVFQAIYHADGIIDYNQRRRGDTVETSRQKAIAEIDEFIHWLNWIEPASLTKPVRMLTEVSLTQTEVCEMMSTQERELTFAALHATHHFAMAKATLSLHHVETDDALGYAPTTASYLRGK
ncbi:hypothetical protein VIM7927_02321 [Vibrio mangrovi]|nr:hypothetical protein VIM7927_02321 [Vibrio mangrovi]